MNPILRSFFSLLSLIIIGCATPSPPQPADNPYIPKVPTEPYKVIEDKMNQTTTTLSSMVEFSGEDSNGFFKPYIIKKGKTTLFRARTLSKSLKPISYNKVSILCGEQKPIHINLSTAEQLSKEISTIISSNEIEILEYGDVLIDKSKWKYIIECDTQITFRLAGITSYAEFDFKKEHSPYFFQGLADLKNYKENK